MNEPQRLWWRQSSSDYDMFELLRGRGEPVCHGLHFLQMSTEKISKAYLWRKGMPPATIHSGFTSFMKFLGQVGRENRERIATIGDLNQDGFLDIVFGLSDATNKAYLSGL